MAKQVKLEMVKKILRPTYHFLLKGKQIGYILMLHRVGMKDPDKIQANENMKVSPAYLEGFIQAHQKKYDYISIEDVPGRLQEPHKGKPFMVFTFDDGYLDNYTMALPIFQKYNVPFTVFIATEYIDGEAALWWYELEDLMLNSNTITLTNEKKYCYSTLQEREKAFLDIRSEILNLDQIDIKNEVNRLLGTDFSWKDKCKSLMMSWEQVYDLSRISLVTIGAHTHHHYNLKRLPSSEMVRDDIIQGCDKIESVLGRKPGIFAYPFGSDNEVSKREIDIVKNMGFKAACVAYGGYCGTKEMNLFSLPRMMLTEDLDERVFQ